MKDTVLVAIIGAIAGLISGGIASIIAPWVNWGIEKRKQKLAHRRELIAHWRGMISRIHTNYESGEVDEYQELSFTDILQRQPEYLSLKPHIPEGYWAKLTKHNLDGTIALVQSKNGRTSVNPIDDFISDLINIVNRIEREWDLV